MNARRNGSQLTSKKWFQTIGLEWKINKLMSSSSQVGLTELDEHYEDPTGDLSYVPTSNRYSTDNQFLSEKLVLVNGPSSYGLSIHSDTESYRENNTLLADSKKCITGMSLCDSEAEQNKTSVSMSYSHFGSTSDISINIKNTWLTRNQDNRVGLSSPGKSDNKYKSWGATYKNYSWSLADIRFDASKGIRLPSLYELFGDRGLLKGNPNIQPESSINSSLELIFNQLTLNTININGASSIYFKKINDAIVPMYSGSVGSFSNTSSAKVIGWQANFLLQKNNLSFIFECSIQDSLTTSSIKSFNEKKLAGIFHEKFTSSLNWNISQKTNIALIHQIESGLYIDMANLNESIRNDTSNLKLSHTLKNGSFNVSINNLFNNEYFDQYNKPAIDRSFSFNFQHQF
jgi:outer membrane cobalamin receptor